MTNQFTVELVGAAKCEYSDFEPIVFARYRSNPFRSCSLVRMEITLYSVRTPLAKNKQAEPS